MLHQNYGVSVSMWNAACALGEKGHELFLVSDGNNYESFCPGMLRKNIDKLLSKDALISEGELTPESQCLAWIEGRNTRSRRGERDEKSGSIDDTNSNENVKPLCRLVVEDIEGTPKLEKKDDVESSISGIPREEKALTNSSTDNPSTTVIPAYSVKVIPRLRAGATSENDRYEPNGHKSMRMRKYGIDVLLDDNPGILWNVIRDCNEVDEKGNEEMKCKKTMRLVQVSNREDSGVLIHSPRSTDMSISTATNSNEKRNEGRNVVSSKENGSAKNTDDTENSRSAKYTVGTIVTEVSPQPFFVSKITAREFGDDNAKGVPGMVALVGYSSGNIF